MQPFPDEIVRRRHSAATGGEALAEAEPAAAVRLVRDGPVPQASCPHCGGRLELSTLGSRWRVRCPSDVADRLTLQLGSLEREELHVLVLNTRYVVIEQERVYQGNVSAAVVRIGELFRQAVAHHAAGIILVHNHPSGDAKPSLNDLDLTAAAIRAGQLLDIAVLDHLIVGGGTFVSLRDYGVAFDEQKNGHTARERSGPWWRDPRYGAYKSALQKHIRRGEIDKAVMAGSALAGLPGGEAMLRRRLTVIAAEDVGWQLVPATAEALQASEQMSPPEAMKQLTGVAAALAGLPKSREAYWLAATCWRGRRIARDVSRSALTEALADGRHQDAMAICLAAIEAREWRSGDRTIDVLTACLADAPRAAQEVGRWALRRAAQGGFGIDELVASAVIAAIDHPADPLPSLVLPELIEHVEPLRLEWYTQDGHTDVGRRALRAVGRRLAVRTERLAALMFNYSSIVSGPSEQRARWRDEALALDARAGGWESVEAGAREWSAVEVKVREAIERGLAQVEWNGRQLGSRG